jgi:CheY-like chemotaxis protein
MQRVLVADDDHQARYQLEEALSGCGFTVETASNGYEALQKLRSEPIEAVFLDLKMPVMDAWVFLQEFQREPTWAHIPVAVMAIEQQASEARKLPAQAFLPKPFRLGALMSALDTLESHSNITS